MSEEQPPDQYDAIHATAWDWLIILDAGRADVFEELYRDYLLEDGDGGVLQTEYHRVDNGGIGYTATWFATMFPEEYDALCFHGGQPIHSMAGGDYDEREHFASVAGMTEYEFDEDLATIPPESVADVVRAYTGGEVDQRLEALGYVAESTPSRGVIRFLQPHPPFPTLVYVTKGRGNRITKTAKAVRSGKLTKADVRDAYVDTYEWGLTVVQDLIADLPGRVIVTADHGECLGDCGQWYHGGGHDMHDHLTEVPWLVVE